MGVSSRMYVYLPPPYRILLILIVLLARRERQGVVNLYGVIDDHTCCRVVGAITERKCLSEGHWTGHWTGHMTSFSIVFEDESPTTSGWMDDT